MGYEDSVYLAKLAEQAERYEGKLISQKLRVCKLIRMHRDGREHEGRCLRRPGALC
jgi:hypothetical protein